MIHEEHQGTISGWLDYLANHGYVFYLEEHEAEYTPEQLEEQWQINEHLLDLYPLLDWCEAQR